MEMAPNKENKISLDKNGIPKVQHYIKDIDKISMVELNNILKREIEDLNIGKVEINFDKDDIWQTMRDASHHMGTTRMGNDSKSSVIDSNSKVHNIENLYIAGASVFPTSGCVNPTYTIVALSIRLAEHIKNNIKNSYDNMEIMFDGAQCLKFGHDIVMNISTYNHQLGFDWLTRHLGDSYRIHPVKITDHHIDGMFMPLKPGVLLINSSTMEGKLNELPKELQKWKVIKVPSAHIEDKAKIQLASENINVNVLPLDTKRVIVFTQDGKPDAQFCDVLDENGFEPITIQLRHSRLFGGGAHCVTLDTVRKGNKERYF